MLAMMSICLSLKIKQNCKYNEDKSRIGARKNGSEKPQLSGSMLMRLLATANMTSNKFASIPQESTRGPFKRGGLVEHVWHLCIYLCVSIDYHFCRRHVEFALVKFTDQCRLFAMQTNCIKGWAVKRESRRFIPNFAATSFAAFNKSTSADIIKSIIRTIGASQIAIYCLIENSQWFIKMEIM